MATSDLVSQIVIAQDSVADGSLPVENMLEKDEKKIDSQKGPIISVSEASAPSHDEAGFNFWSNHCVPVLSSLLQGVGSYTSDQVEHHLQFLNEHVIPNMGPIPDKVRPKSLLTPNGSPFEVSINVRGGNPLLRFGFEPIMPRNNSFQQSPVPAISEAVGGDMRWFQQFADEWWATEDERDIIKGKMPPDTARIPLCFLSFDLEGNKKLMKAYFSPIMKHMATGVNSDEAAINLIRSLKPYGDGFESQIKLIQDYRGIGQEPVQISVIGIDCIDPNQGARVKVYTNPRTNTFEAVRDAVTFGGRRTDETTLQGLEIIRKVWHLLLDEPEENVNDVFSKDVIDPTSGHQGLCTSWELRPFQEMPDVKVYVPVFQYFKNDKAISEAFEKAFNKQGWSLGVEGAYRKLIRDTFGPEIMAEANNDPLVHSYMSFNFSKKRGTYMTSYMSPLIRFT